jgi:type I restriction-modification system DNA methylase subunit
MQEGDDNIVSFKNIMKNIQKLSMRHQTWKVFSDFCEMSAIAISNSVDKVNKDKRETRYLDIVKQYEKEEIDLFPTMFADLVESLQFHAENHKLEDVLGRIFHELELHNQWKGQYFTPMNVCNAMGQMTLQGHDEIIKQNGYITVGEPCVGSGAMILGIANALIEGGYNYSKHMVVTGTDIDLKCVHMAYIQFSLYGIPAIVVHGNSLTVETWSTWYTPLYVLNNMITKTNEVSA